jgi:peptidyl-prolyl cis-trans isomerase D
MAAIGKIREHGGFLTVIIGLALASFVIGPKAMDLFFKKAPEFDNSSIGIINGQKIDLDYFSNRVDEQIENVKFNRKVDNLSNEETFTITMQVWDQVKKETLLHQQEVAVGLALINESTGMPEISAEEYRDMTVGSNPHPLIVQNFTDRSTGQFNPNYVIQFLENVQAGMQSEDPKQVEQAMTSNKQWKQLVKYMKEDRLSTKYYNLIKKGYYIPTALAEMDYKDRNTSEKVRYTAVRYAEVKDDEVNPTDADYQTYYDAHKNDFKQNEETRKINYVVWHVRPSQEDIAAIRKEAEQIKAEFKNIEPENVPIYVNSYRGSHYDSLKWYKKDEVSPFIDSVAFNDPIGTIMGPWVEDNAYHVARLMDRAVRPDSMRASHILIAYSGAYGAAEDVTRTKIGARALADSLLEVAKKGNVEFDSLAVKYSTDPSVAENKGDLNWFADGQMVYEFNQACIDHNVGDIVVVETNFGYHVLKVTGKKNEVEKIRLATINLPISFSKETHNEAFMAATQFAGRVHDLESFDTVSTNMQLNVMKGDYINATASEVMGLPKSRSIVRWMFKDDVNVGTVSDVFDMDDQIVVAVISGVVPKGYAPLNDEVKNYIKPLVIRDLKAKILLDKLQGQSDMYAVAAANNSTVDTANFITFTTYSLPKYGPEHNVQGHMFASETAKTYGPLKGDQGVYFYVVDEITPAPANTANYRFTREQLINTFQPTVEQGVINALSEKAEIKDFRKYVY